MRGLGILILCVLFFWLCWPPISRWLKRKAMERAENYMRRAMGMPPREKPNKNKWRQKTGSRDAGRNYDGFNQGDYYYHQKENGGYGTRRQDESIIPKEYAEDVDFVETKDYSQTQEKPEYTAERYHESQISDVEWTEIKTGKETRR